MAEGFQVVNYSRSPVSGTWKFSANQSGTSASSIYPEVKGTTAYQVEFIPTETSEGQYGETLTQSVIPEISPKELHAVLTTPIEKNYDGSTDIALEATVKIGASGQSYPISGLKGSFEDANAGTGSALADVLSALAESFHAEWSRLLDNSLLSRAQLRTCRAVSAKLEEDLMELRKSGITDWNEGFALFFQIMGDSCCRNR